MASESRASIAFGRAVCNDAAAVGAREWLATNGIGGFASAAIDGSLTRRYHGILVAALKPPLGRTLLVAKYDERVSVGGAVYDLATNSWGSGATDPRGYLAIERFELDGTIAIWTFSCGDARLEKRLWMEYGENSTYVTYRLLRASSSIELSVKALVNYRDFHGTTHAGAWQMQIDPHALGIGVTAFPDAHPYWILADRGTCTPANTWYRDFALARERERGLDDRDDHLHAATFTATLDVGETLTLVATLESLPALDGTAALTRRRAGDASMLEQWAAGQPAARTAPPWIARLVVVADQFIVSRPLAEEPQARSVIAGYHWFGDWGRDAMVALPGLTLATGRPEIARTLLRSFARYVDGGMLPNFFPDSGEAPAFNSADASLWYIEAVRAYYAATRDRSTLAVLFGTLAAIVEAYTHGTRYGIGVDAGDGLVRAGEPGKQLTWMDAKIGDWVVTPRIGKPVELNALWYNALAAMAHFADELTPVGAATMVAATRYRELAALVRISFERYWNSEVNYCFDVIDGPDGNDPSIRPNALFAAALTHCPLEHWQQRAIVDLCGRRLATSYSVRSLDPDDPRYVGQYGGSQWERDAAYHEGTGWCWLIGPYVAAHLRVYDDPVAALSILHPIADLLVVDGIGTIGELTDGDSPFASRGAIAQAWSVGSILQAWHLVAGRLANAKQTPS